MWEEYLNPLNISITEFAKQIGVSRKVLSDVVNEKAGISPVMIALVESPKQVTTILADHANELRSI